MNNHPQINDFLIKTFKTAIERAGYKIESLYLGHHILYGNTLSPYLQYFVSFEHEGTILYAEGSHNRFDISLSKCLKNIQELTEEFICFSSENVKEQLKFMKSQIIVMQHMRDQNKYTFSEPRYKNILSKIVKESTKWNFNSFSNSSSLNGVAKTKINYLEIYKKLSKYDFNPSSESLISSYNLKKVV